MIADLRELAQNEGVEVDNRLDEALADLIEKHRKTNTRPQVMAAHRKSREKFGSLYEKLAK